VLAYAHCAILHIVTAAVDLFLRLNMLVTITFHWSNE
jgi:hypothetical protein